jgi:DnaJ-class molecular chaperone
MPMAGQETLGGTNLRNCLANCQSGLSPEQTTIQECYTCNGGGIVQKITGEDRTQAQTVCEQIAGSEATITNVEPGTCPY